ncbi:2-iminobutanoate/2-iminopropanoate deaminase-like isoform X3 [Hydractinia symbiolongicarpus]|uniref:2-iminobutanoate/2-iminopropanoate deaminase-like isoform X3 n=1 Tax=Hydractinia symbiolongicarpus TaxID=13093 RepID=UPI00254A6874|nr:2-iminobutanoate/2-iminopropanoate deaminase-like isoform X3 [Hydractinia symbiolongicarpus]
MVHFKAYIILETIEDFSKRDFGIVYVWLMFQTMDFVSNDVQEQTKQALTNMKAILEAAGSSFANVVETTILLADINDYKAVNDVYATFFKAPFPARAAFECANLPKRGKVEIRAKAIVGPLEDIELSSKL